MVCMNSNISIWNVCNKDTLSVVTLAKMFHFFQPHSGIEILHSLSIHINQDRYFYVINGAGEFQSILESNEEFD